MLARRGRRLLSTLTLAQPEHKDAVLRGEAPRGPLVPAGPPAPPRPKSELEAQLDRELAALD